MVHFTTKVPTSLSSEAREVSLSTYPLPVHSKVPQNSLVSAFTESGCGLAPAEPAAHIINNRKAEHLAQSSFPVVVVIQAETQHVLS